MAALHIEKAAACRALHVFPGARNPFKQLSRLIGMLVSMTFTTKHFNVGRIIPEIRVSGERFDVMPMQVGGGSAPLTAPFFHYPRRNDLAALRSRLGPAVNVFRVACPLLLYVLALVGAEARLWFFPARNRSGANDAKRFIADLTRKCGSILFFAREVAPSARQRAGDEPPSLVVRKVRLNRLPAVGAIGPDAARRNHFHAASTIMETAENQCGSRPRKPKADAE